MATNSTLLNAYTIGQSNFNAWSSGYDASGYLKVLPLHTQEVVFKNPYRDWQQDKPGNYISSWGAAKELNTTLTMSDLTQVTIDGFGTLKAGDSVTPWLGGKFTPYELLRAYNGTIPGPMLITEPGDTVNITLVNDLKDPLQISNLHAHGLHVSPVGNGDNVLISVKPGESFNYSYKIPDDSAIGPNWYHPHLHGLTNEQVSSGLAGALIVNAPHDLPDINKFNPKEVPTHIFAINSFGIQQVLRNGSPTDPLNQNPATPVPAGTPLQVINGNEYTLSDAPFMGYNAKTLSFVYDPTKPTGDPANNKFPYGGGPQEEPVENVIHTVNGQYNPTLHLKTGEWNAFSFMNMNSQAFHVIQLVRDTGTELIPITMSLVGIDGVTGTKRTDVKELPILAPGSRLSIQQWFQDPGTYYVLSDGTEEILGNNAPSLTKNKGFKDGHLIWGPQVLATIEVTGASIPTGSPPQPFDISTQKAQKIDAFVTSVKNGDYTRERTFDWSANLGKAVGLSKDPVEPPDDADAKTFEGTYGINGQYFSHNFIDSMVPLAMPMLGSKEIWRMKNSSGSIDPALGAKNVPLLEWHPFHIHQNDFAVLEINGIPVEQLSGQYQLNGYLSDTVNLPPTHATGSVSLANPYGTPQIGGNTSEVKLAMNFEDFPGSFVNHCHILFHEDAGMMAPVRIVLNTDKTWLGLGVRDNTNGQVSLVRASNLRNSISFTPYGPDFLRGIGVAIGDFRYKSLSANNNNVTDNVTDIVTIQRSLQQSGDKFKVKIFDGKTFIDQRESGKTILDGLSSQNIINEIDPFQNITFSTEQIASVAVGDVNGDGFADVVVGIGGGIASQIEIYSGKDSTLLSRINPFHHETTFTGSINLAVGDANGDNYDDIIVGQGAGGKGLVEVYDGKVIDAKGTVDGKNTAHESALLSQTFRPYGDTYTGEVDVTSGYILQRPEQAPIAGTTVQTYRANITTVAKGLLPDGYKQVNVWTYIGSGEHGHTNNTSTTNTQPEIRQDIGFTPNDRVDKILGTFADLPNSLRGEPVLFARTQSGAYELIHLKDGNVPEIIPISSQAATLTKNPSNDIFTIQNDGIDKPRLKIILKGRGAGSVNELGVFFVDDDLGTINGIAPKASGYTETALKRSKEIFSAIANSPNGFTTENLTRILELNAGAKLRFYLANNTTKDAVLSGLSAYTDILFTDPANEKTTDLGGNSFLLSWKDGSGNSVSGFEDLVVNIQSTNDLVPLGTNLQGKSQGEVLDLRDMTGQMKASFVVNREAAFNNFVGFYAIADENGGIDTNGDGKADVLVGQSGYIQAAIRGRVAGIDLMVNNQGTATFTGVFNPGTIFAPFIIANGTPDKLLDDNVSNDPQVYFPFLGANSDRSDHIRMLGSNIFGFEDLPNTGDKDYNDVIVTVKLTAV